jgi:hypothetical protein
LLTALLWSAFWWGIPWRNVAMLMVSCVMASVLIFALARDTEGRSFSFVRGCTMGSVLLLLLLPQTFFDMP